MRITIATIAVGAILITAPAACSSSSHGNAAAGGSHTATGTTAGSGSGAGSGNGSDSLDAKLPSSTNVCTILPVSTVAQITGKPFDTADPDSTPSYEIFSCDYTSSAFDQLTISVLGLDGAPGYDADVSAFQTAGATINKIDGVGDKAFATSIAGGAVGQADIMSGPILITMNGLSTLTEDQIKQIFAALQPKL